VIRLESVRIQEFRGIRDLSLKFRGSNFAICGNNGTGKSGIVDALEFALTGRISRLAGEGSGNVSVREHGPHVDARDAPEKAKVTLEVSYSGDGAATKKTLTITRHLKAPNKPAISPKDAVGIAALKGIEAHPELVLSRRQLIRYVLTSPAERSKQVQALLRLDHLEQVRAHLQKIANSAERTLVPLEEQVTATTANLIRAIDIPAYSNEAFLERVNSRRTSLGLSPIADVSPTLSVMEGMQAGDAAPRPVIDKQQAFRDMGALKDFLRELRASGFLSELSDIKKDVDELARDPATVQMLNREAFYSNGLSFVELDLANEVAACPLCDTKWAPAALRAHLKEKLDRLRAFAERRRNIEARLGAVLARLRRGQQVLATVAGHARAAGATEPGAEVAQYGDRLDHHCRGISELFPLADCSAMLAAIAAPPVGVNDALAECEKVFAAIPVSTEQEEARRFLIVVQERIAAVRDARKRVKQAKEQAAVARRVVDTYATTCDAVLAGIYSEVREEFESLYRLIHHHDEKEFTAELTPSAGALEMKVDFYGRGHFPPGAYHSEGHQDGMGLCLYLALMQHLQGPAFTFAVFDDVLMSIDAGHRREVATVLKKRFAGTQFILTTHDKHWLEHMKTEKLIANRSAVHFRRWNVGSGPSMWVDRGVWTEAEASLKKDDVRSAAGELRHHLEYISAELCARLRASVEFRPDGQYQLGELLPKAIVEFRDLLKKAKAAANSHGKREDVEKIGAQEQAFQAIAGASHAEMWPVNTAIHYNSWESLSPGEFGRVLDAFKALIAAFSCAGCGELYRVIPSHEARQALACDCSSLTLVPKRKEQVEPAVRSVH
jgi:recombinational DNA repair ATPase RecF